MATVNNQNLPVRHQNQSSQGSAELFRVGGSGFTAFHWEGKIIGFAQAVSHTSPQPVAAPVAIQPMDRRYPMQIITPAAIGPGTLQVQLYELYNSKVWDRIMEIVDLKHPNGANRKPGSRYNDLAEIFIRLANIGKGISTTKLIYPPNKVQANKTQYYADTYLNCVITDIRDDEDIDIGRMEIVKNLTIQYTHSRRVFAHV